MATGLLVLVTGNATRLAQFYGKADKTYFAEITFGRTSDTYDTEGEILIFDSAAACGRSYPGRARRISRYSFCKLPPPVSAKKIGGVPAYKLARQKIAVELKPVEVEVKNLEIENLQAGKLTIVVTCSAGTYIRSIAHDLGQRLGCGALLSSLRRTQSGDYSVKQARTLDELAVLVSENRLCEALIPISEMLPEMPSEYFGLTVETQIRQGRAFRTSPFVVPPGAPLVKALSRSGDLIAIGELKIPNLYHPGTVF